MKKKLKKKNHEIYYRKIKSLKQKKREKGFKSHSL